MSACLLMYGSAVTHYLVNFRSLMWNNGILESNIQSIATCAEDIKYSKPDGVGGAALQTWTSACGQSSLLLVNVSSSCRTSRHPHGIQIVLSDAIVAWRVCAIWPQSKVLNVWAILTVFTTLGK